MVIGAALKAYSDIKNEINNALKSDVEKKKELEFKRK
jgi:hypothetical protein